MPNSKKKRVSKTSPNTAGEIRKNRQHEREVANRYMSENDLALTPWQAQKARRLADRQKAGKTFANWSRSLKSTRPTVSNLETNV